MAGPQEEKKTRPGSIWFRFRKASRKASVFPESAGLEKLDALTSFEDAALGADGAGGLEAAMLGHGKGEVGVLKIGLGEYAHEGVAQPFFEFGQVERIFVTHRNRHPVQLGLDWTG